MRQDLDKDTFRQKAVDIDWKQPVVSEIAISRDEIEAITKASNPKSELRNFFRRWRNSHPK